MSEGKTINIFIDSCTPSNITTSCSNQKTKGIQESGWLIITHKKPKHIYGSGVSKSGMVGLYFELKDADFTTQINSNFYKFVKLNGDFIQYNFGERTSDIYLEYALKSITLGNKNTSKDLNVANGQIVFLWNANVTYPEVLSINSGPIILDGKDINQQYDCIIDFTTLSISLIP